MLLKKWNKNHVMELGYSDEELNNIQASAFFTKNEFQRITKKIEDVFVKGYAQMRTTLITKSGERKPFLLEGYPYIDKNKTYFMEFGLNISQQQRLEKDFQRAEKRIKIHFNNNRRITEKLNKGQRELLATTLQLIKSRKSARLMRGKINELIIKYPDNIISKELVYFQKILKIENRANENWELFKIRFREVHPNFFKNIKAVHPEISKAELHYCVYLKINMSTSQIIAATNVTSEAVRKIRYRIRKKLDYHRKSL